MANKQYDINHSNLRNLNVNLLYVTSAKYETDWHSIMHTHSFTEIFYCIKGRGRFHVENKIFDVKEDDLVIVNANVNHTESSKESEPLEYIVLGIEGISLFFKDREDHLLYSLHNYHEYKHEILFYIKSLLMEAKSHGNYYDLITQNLLEILIYNIIRRADGTLTLSNNSNINSNLDYIKNYIESCFEQNISLDKLCDMSYINKFYLVHSFKKMYGITPMQHLNNVRLKKASQLLKNTNHSIGQIAQIVGMSSQSYFAQNFKKHFNLSPNKYRNLKKQEF